MSPRTARWWLALGALSAAFPVATAAAQRLELTPLLEQVTVGDVVTFRAKAFMGPQQFFFDKVPKPAAPLPPGMRYLGADSLIRQPDGTWIGAVRFAFYRPGRSALPPVVVRFGWSAAQSPRPLAAEPSEIEVLATLTPGNQSLRDVKDELTPGLRDPLTVMALVLLAAAFLWRRRRRSRLPSARAAPGARTATDPNPIDDVLRQLDELATRSLPDRAAIVLVYAEVSHLLLALMDRLGHGDGMPPALDMLLLDADAVKFAAVRPDAPTARAFVASARELVAAWPASAPAEEDALAIR